MIPLLALSLAVSTAHAFEPNREFAFGIGLVYAPHVESTRGVRPRAPPDDGLPRPVVSRPDQPWAVELQATQRYALGNHCGWNETDCGGGLGGSGIWPLVGPRVAVTWRGATRFGGRVTAFGGFGVVDMHQFGFFPLWEVDGEVGLAGEISTGPALVLAAEAGRSLSYNERVGEFGTRTHGMSMLAARLGAMVHLDPSGFHDPRYRFALEMCTAAGDYI